MWLLTSILENHYIGPRWGGGARAAAWQPPPTGVMCRPAQNRRPVTLPHTPRAQIGRRRGTPASPPLPFSLCPYCTRRLGPSPAARLAGVHRGAAAPGQIPWSPAAARPFSDGCLAGAAISNNILSDNSCSNLGIGLDLGAGRRHGVGDAGGCVCNCPAITKVGWGADQAAVGCEWGAGVAAGRGCKACGCGESRAARGMREQTEIGLYKCRGLLGQPAAQGCQCVSARTCVLQCPSVLGCNAGRAPLLSWCRWHDITHKDWRAYS
jgi:hypothetical protein